MRVISFLDKYASTTNKVDPLHGKQDLVMHIRCYEEFSRNFYLYSEDKAPRIFSEFGQETSLDSLYIPKCNAEDKRGTLIMLSLALAGEIPNDHL